MQKVLQNKIALVTGATRGLGKAIAIHLAEAGAHVIAIGRSQAGLEELDDQIKSLGGAATLVPMDLKDELAIDRLGQAIFDRWQKLDILIGNAAVLGKLTPLGHLEPSVWNDVMAINVTANYRLIRSMDPLLRAADHGRAVFVTSGLAQKCWPYWGPYSVSKAALEALVKTYAAEIATSNIRVNAFSPGATATKMRATAMPGEDPAILPTPETVGAQIIAMCTADFMANGAVYKFSETGLFKQA